MTSDIDQTLELPWAKSYIHVVLKQRGLDKLVSEGGVEFSKTNDAFLKAHWEQITPYTLLDPFRMGVLLDIVEKTLSIPGNIVECGCYRGGTGFLMAMYLKAKGINKKIHLFDSFEGLPSVDEENDKGYRAGEFKSNLEELNHNVSQFGLDDFIVVHKGWFSDTVGGYIDASPEISLLHIDCDLYSSTIDSYGPLSPFVTNGGAVIFDDFNDGGGGEKKAFKELNNTPRNLVVGPAPQTYYFNGEDGAASHTLVDEKTTYVLDELLANKAYLDWLQTNVKLNYADEIARCIADNS